MYSLCLIILLGLLLSFLVYFISKNNEDAVYTFFITCVICVFIGFIVSVLIIQEMHENDKSHYVKDYEHIYAIKTNTSIDGNFFIGTGKINSINRYIVFMKTEDDGMYQKSFDIDSCIVYECDTISPQVKYIYKTIRNQKYKKWLLFPNYNSFHKYHIYVPKNSIYYNYNVK